MRPRIVFLIILISITNPEVWARGRKHFKDNFEESNDDLADSEVRSIIAAIVDAILDGDRRKRSELKDDDPDSPNVPAKARSNLNNNKWNNRWYSNNTFFAKDEIPARVANITAENDVDDSLQAINSADSGAIKKSNVKEYARIISNEDDVSPMRNLNNTLPIIDSSSLYESESSEDLSIRARSAVTKKSPTLTKVVEKDEGSGAVEKRSKTKVTAATPESVTGSGSGEPDREHSKRNLILEDENLGMVSKRLVEDKENDENDETSGVGSAAESGLTPTSGDGDVQPTETTSDRRNQVAEASLRKSFIRNDSLPVASLTHADLNEHVSNPSLAEGDTSGEISGSGHASAIPEASVKSAMPSEISGSGDLLAQQKRHLNFEQATEQITEIKNKFINAGMQKENNEITGTRNFEVINNYENTNTRTFDTYENPQKATNPISYLKSSELRVANFGRSKKGNIAVPRVTSKRSEIEGEEEPEESSGSGNEVSGSGTSKKSDVASGNEGSTIGSSGSGSEKQKEATMADKRHDVSEHESESEESRGPENEARGSGTSNESGSAEQESGAEDEDKDEEQDEKEDTPTLNPTLGTTTKTNSNQKSNVPVVDDVEITSASGETSGFTEPDPSSADFDVSGSGSGSGDSDASEFNDIGVDYKAYNNKVNLNKRHHISKRRKGYSPGNYAHMRKARFYQSKDKGTMLDAQNMRMRERAYERTANTRSEIEESDPAYTVEESRDKMSGFTRIETTGPKPITRAELMKQKADAEAELVAKSIDHSSNEENKNETKPKIEDEHGKKDEKDEKDFAESDKEEKAANPDDKLDDLNTNPKPKKDEDEKVTLADIKESNETKSAFESKEGEKSAADSKEEEKSAFESKEGENAAKAENEQKEANEEKISNEEKAEGETKMADEENKELKEGEKAGNESENAKGNEQEKEEEKLKESEKQKDDNNEKSIAKVEAALKDDDESSKVAKEVADAIDKKTDDSNVNHDNRASIDDSETTSEGSDEKNGTVTGEDGGKADFPGKKIDAEDGKGHLHRIKVQRNDEGTLEEVEFYHNKSGLYETDKSFADIDILRNETLFSSRLQNDSEAINHTLYNYLHKNNWSKDTYNGKSGPLGDSVYGYLEWSEHNNVSSDALLNSRGVDKDNTTAETQDEKEKPYIEQDSLTERKKAASGTITSFGDQDSKVDSTANSALNEDAEDTISEDRSSGTEKTETAAEDNNNKESGNNEKSDFNMTTDSNIKVTKHDPDNWNNVSYYAGKSIENVNLGSTNLAINTTTDEQTKAQNVEGGENAGAAPTGENSNVQMDSGAENADAENAQLSGVLNGTNSTESEQEMSPKDNSNSNKTDIKEGASENKYNYYDKTEGGSGDNENDLEKQLEKSDNSTTASETDFDYLHKNPTPNTTAQDKYAKHGKEEMKEIKKLVKEGDLSKEALEEMQQATDEQFPFLHHNPEPNVTDFYSLHQVPKHVKAVSDKPGESGEEIFNAEVASNNEGGTINSAENGNTNFSPDQSSSPDNVTTAANIDLSNEEPGANVTIDVDEENANITQNDSSNITETQDAQLADAISLYESEHRDKQIDGVNKTVLSGTQAFSSAKNAKAIPLKELGKMAKNDKKDKKKPINLDVKVYSSGVTNIYVDKEGKVAVKKVSGDANVTEVHPKEIINKNNTIIAAAKNSYKPTKLAKGLKGKGELEEDIMEDEENVYVDNRAYTEGNEYVEQVKIHPKSTEIKVDKNGAELNTNETSFEHAKVDNNKTKNENESDNTYVDSKHPKQMLNDKNNTLLKAKNMAEPIKQKTTPVLGFKGKLGEATPGDKSKQGPKNETKNDKSLSSNITDHKINPKAGPRKPTAKMADNKKPSEKEAEVKNNTAKGEEKNVTANVDTKSIEIDDMDEIKPKKLKQVNFEKDKKPAPVADSNENIKHGGGDAKNDKLGLGNDTSANAVSQSALKIVEDLVDIINTTHSKKSKTNSSKDEMTNNKGDANSKRRNFSLPGTNMSAFDEEQPLKAVEAEANNEMKDKKKLHILEITSMIVSGMKKNRMAAARRKKQMNTAARVPSSQQFAPASKRHILRHTKKRKPHSSSLISVVKRDAYESPYGYQGNDLPEESSELIPPYKEKKNVIEIQSPLENEETNAASLVSPQFMDVVREKNAESVKRNTIPTPSHEFPVFRNEDIEGTESKKTNIQIPPDMSNTNQNVIPQPMLAALQKRNVIPTGLALNNEDDSKQDADDSQGSQAIESIDKRDKIWTDDQDEQDSNIITPNPDATSQDSDVSPEEESVVKSRPYPLELQSPPSEELRSNILDMLASSETVNRLTEADNEQGSGSEKEASQAESGSAESALDLSGDDLASAVEPGEDVNAIEKRDTIAKSVIMKVIRQAERHLNGIHRLTDNAEKQRRHFVQKLVHEDGTTTTLHDKAIYAEDVKTEGSAGSSGSGELSGNSEDEDGDNSLPYVKAKNSEKNQKEVKTSAKVAPETKDSIVKQLVKEMARAAIDSVEDTDSHVVVKKSQIFEKKMEINVDGENVVKRSDLTEDDFVNAANDKDGVLIGLDPTGSLTQDVRISTEGEQGYAWPKRGFGHGEPPWKYSLKKLGSTHNWKIHTALKLLVNTLLNEGPSKGVDKGDLLRVKRMETEKKLENDMLANEAEGSGEESKKTKVITDVKDFVGLAEELSQSDFLTPYKHDAIANKLEGDLVKNLKLSKQQSATIFKEEDNLLKASEMEYIKDKIDREFSRNDGASRKEKIAAIKKIVRSLPLSKEDSDDLTKTIKEANWLNVASNSKRRHSKHSKHRSN